MTKEKKVKNRVGDKSLTITRNIVRIFLVIWTILILFPLFWAILSSLKTNKEFAINAWTLPAELQWVNYKNAWLGANFSKFFANSLMLSVGTVILSIIMPTSTAYVVGKFVHPVVKGVEVFYSVFMMVPQVLLLIPLLQMCKKLNMTKDDAVLFTLMLTNALQGVPFYVFLLTPFVRSINNSILEAAEIDGANQFQAFSMLILPLIVPAIFMVGLLSFVGIWNEYIMSITFIKDQAKYTLSVGINELMNDATAGETLKFAALIIAMLPILIVYAIFQKPLQDGLSSSDGVKG